MSTTRTDRRANRTRRPRSGNLALRTMRVAVVLGLVVASTIVLGAPPAGADPSCTTVAGVTTCDFAFTGAPQAFTVPPGVTSLTISVTGGQGGGPSAAGEQKMSRGATATAAIAVTPGEVLQVTVGGAGTYVTGGYNGGGPGITSGATSGGGAGATDLRRGSCAATLSCGLEDRVLVGGGGGGTQACTTSAAGASLGGTPDGADGWQDTVPSGYAGRGGTQVAGGAGGETAVGSSGPVIDGTPGTLGVGGAGGHMVVYNGGCSGGGGGGGYFGGGGGGGGDYSESVSGGGGGGGSSYGPAGTTYEVTSRLGDGAASIQWTSPVAPVFTAASPPLTAQVGVPYSYTFAATGVPAPTFGVDGTLPSWLSLDATSGLLHGTPTAVGTTTFRVTASNGVDPQAVTGDLTITVGKANATVTLSGLSATYDGSPHAVGVSTDPPGLDVNVTYDGSGTPPTDAGDYAVVATVNDADYAGSASGTLTIGEAPATVSLSGLSATYDTLPHAVGVSTDPPGLDVHVTYDGSPTPPTDAGSYTVDARVNDPNHDGYVSGTLTIDKAGPTVTVTAPATATVGGGPVTVSASSPSTGAITWSTSGPCTNVGDQVTVTGSGSCVVTASQASDVNYEAASGQATIAVGKGAATVTLSGLSVTYDGSPHVVGVSTDPSGLHVDVTYDGSATPPTNAAFYTVVATIDDPNYAGSATSVLTIEKAPATVTLSGLNVTYDGSPHAVGVTTDPAGLDVTVTYDSLPTVPSEAGTYSVIATVTDPNYTGSVIDTLTIAKTTPTLPVTAPVVGVVGPDPVTVSASSPSTGAITWSTTGACINSGDQVTFTEAGSCVVTASQEADTNYESATADATIEVHEPLTISAPAVPEATVGRPFSFAPSAEGGDGVSAVVWSIEPEGALPDGLELNADTGEITGTPATAGSYDFTLVAAGSETATLDLTILVADAPPPPPPVPSTTVPPAPTTTMPPTPTTSMPAPSTSSTTTSTVPRSTTVPSPTTSAVPGSTTSTPQAAPDHGQLPKTGFGAFGQLLWAIGGVLVGAALVLVARARGRTRIRT